MCCVYFNFIRCKGRRPLASRLAPRLHLLGSCRRDAAPSYTPMDLRKLSSSLPTTFPFFGSVRSLTVARDHGIFLATLSSFAC